MTNENLLMTIPNLGGSGVSSIPYYNADGFPLAVQLTWSSSWRGGSCSSGYSGGSGRGSGRGGGSCGGSCFIGLTKLTTSTACKSHEFLGHFALAESRPDFTERVVLISVLTRYVYVCLNVVYVEKRAGQVLHALLYTVLWRLV